MEIVRRMYEAFGRRDTAKALACLGRDVTIDATHRVDGRVGKDHDQVSAILAEWLGTWDEWQEELEAMQEAGDRVLVLSTQYRPGAQSRLAVGVEQLGALVRQSVRPRERHSGPPL